MSYHRDLKYNTASRGPSDLGVFVWTLVEFLYHIFSLLLIRVSEPEMEPAGSGYFVGAETGEKVGDGAMISVRSENCQKVGTGTGAVFIKFVGATGANVGFKIQWSWSLQLLGIFSSFIFKRIASMGASK